MSIHCYNNAHFYILLIDTIIYKSKFFDYYKPMEDCNSVEEYNLQLAEVDANAFAAIIMIDCFHLQPQWNGLSNKVIKAINARIDYILT